MNLAQLNTRANDNDGVEFIPDHPVTGDPLDWRFQILSKNSDVVRNIVRKQTKKMQAKSRTSFAPIDFDEVDQESTLALCACIVGWETSFTDANGQPLVYSPDAAVNLLTDTGFAWLRRQLDTATGETARFFPKAAPTSSPGRANTSGSTAPQTPPTPLKAA